MQIMDELDILYHDKDLIKILQKVPEMVELQISYEKVKYFVNFQKIEVVEEFIFEVYEPILNIAATSSRPFTNFSQENYDYLTRLKWKWIHKNLAFNN